MSDDSSNISGHKPPPDLIQGLACRIPSPSSLAAERRDQRAAETRSSVLCARQMVNIDAERDPASHRLPR